MEYLCTKRILKVERAPESFDDYNRIALDDLIADVDLALTFTDIASDHRNLETVKRTTRNARAAYNMIAGRRKSILMSDKDAVTLNSKLSALKATLIKLD